MERKKYFRLVLGSSSPASQGVVRALKLPDGVDVDDFCLVLHGKRESLNLPPSLEPSALKVFANGKAPTPLELDKSLENYGVNTADPLIVRVPRIWFQLKGADRRDLSCPASVPLTEEDAVEVLLDAVQKFYKDNHLAGIAASDLVVYAGDDFTELLARGGQIGSRGNSEQTPLIVMMAPMRLPIDIGEEQNESKRQELQRYQKQGELIHNNCKDYCGQILDKIDYYYEHDDGDTLPFICVQGSSGMGKSQLAFALGGHRPYFYWLGVSGGVGGQVLYGNFTSISTAFLDCVRLDQPNAEKSDHVLDTSSSFYGRDLWTFGFLRALLEHCDLSTSKMIRFEEPVTLRWKSAIRKLCVL
ncbi:hypothetical protein PHYSODRAFT_296375 [Phytophthora sojae]|uniref:Uncharacterized protein n=1 Tax=Phytophthora sojae (strain P6497) TaxID=1094619 RepID=G4YTK0_PHYSP|nr:hypothetical protein PHYSODRAFT_296375 [Phytophthora sojae]EGZ24228.1 hypothetical protein PHYSODRAFT_296375 [Phytophthora sojae]|eukprot:XP_009519516.1 hypothetical protein PHYSODRAFT_296375 [Phytophthora sojae]